MESTLQAKLAINGFKVFPCRKNKSPKTRGSWLKTATDDLGLINDHESEYWGVPCGEPNGIVVIDVDKYKNTFDPANFPMEDLKQGQMITTQSGGEHYVFLYDSSICDLKNGNNVGGSSGIDFKTTGGYVIAYGLVDKSTLRSLPESIVKFLRNTNADNATFIKAPDLSSDEKVAKLEEFLQNINPDRPFEEWNFILLKLKTIAGDAAADAAFEWSLTSKFKKSKPIERHQFDGMWNKLRVTNKYSKADACLLYTSPSPRDRQKSRMPSSA